MLHTLLRAGITGETDRLAALAAADLLDPTPPDDLHGLTLVAADLLGAPAFITLVDDTTLYAHIASASPFPPMSRCDTVCAEVIRQEAPLVVPDLLLDPRFATSAAVRLGARCYAGIAVHAPGPDGRPQPIGSLCAIDGAAREFSPGQIASLRRLGRLADSLLAARAAARRGATLAADVARRNRILQQAERLTGIGSWRLAVPANRIEWSDGVYAIYALPPGAPPPLDRALLPYPPDARERVAERLAHTLATGDPFDFEEDFHDWAGQQRRVRCLGEREEADGQVLGVVGVFQDVTDRHQVEGRLRRDAATDPVTGLLNRHGFNQALADAIARAAAGAPLALAMIDLDGFKLINDTFGHQAGDEVLALIGHALADGPPGTIAARLGGDEFAILIEEPGLCAAPDRAIERLAAALRVPVAASPVPLLAAGSVGWASFSGQGAADFVREADAALYAAKRIRVGDRRQGDRRQGDRRQGDRRREDRRA